MEIIDTVYLVAYFKQTDPLHKDSVEIIEKLSERRVVSQASLIEFDLLMKTHNFTIDERIKTWYILKHLINNKYLEPITPSDMITATYLTSKYKLDYFDSLITAQCINRNAKPLTNDREIIDIFSKKEKIISELEKCYKKFYVI